MIKVIDNLLTPTYADNLEHDVNNTLYYSYNEYTVAQGIHYNGPVYKDENTYDVGQMSCVITYQDRQFPFSWYAERLKVLMYTIVDKVPEVQFNGISRLKANLLVQQPHAPAGHYNTPHQDSTDNTYSALYYCNDSDGDTVLFDQFYEEGKAPDKFTIAQRIQPKKNRLIVFESNRFHASSYPVDTKARFVFNMIFDAKLK